MIIKRKLFSSTLEEENVDLSSRVYLPNGMMGFKGKDGITYYAYDPKNPKNLKKFDKSRSKDLFKLHDQIKGYESNLVDKTRESIENKSYEYLKKSLDGTSKFKEVSKGAGIGAFLGAGAGMALGGENKKSLLIGAGLGALTGGSVLGKLYNDTYKAVKNHENRYNIGNKSK